MSNSILNSSLDFITSTHPSDYITPTQATHLIPKFNGKRVNVSTIHRWIQRGVGGIHLAHWRCGRKVVTTEQALSSFFFQLATANSAHADRQRTSTRRKHRPRPAQRQAAQNEAEAILRKAKILV